MSSSQRFIQRRLHDSTQKTNPYFQKTQRSFLERHWEALLSVLLIFIAAVYFIGFSGTFIVNRFIISGNVYITNEVLTATFREITSGKRGLVLPQNNILFFPEQTAKKMFTDRYVLENIDISKKYPHEIFLTLKERIPGLTYRVNGETFYMDRAGVTTERITEAPDPRYPVIDDANARDADVQQALLPEKLVVFYLSLVEQFPENIGLTVTSGEVGAMSCSRPEVVKETIVPQETDAETEEEENTELKNRNANGSNDTEDEEPTIVEVVRETAVDCDGVDLYHQLTIKTEQDVLIHFTTLDTLDAQIERLQLLIHQHLKTLEGVKYVDLRFGNKIYYQ